jgi:hypothetical protein
MEESVSVPGGARSFSLLGSFRTACQAHYWGAGGGGGLSGWPLRLPLDLPSVPRIRRHGAKFHNPAYLDIS